MLAFMSEHVIYFLLNNLLQKYMMHKFHEFSK